MSSSSTSKLGLFKAVAGTGEPFRTSDLNSNWDKLDADSVSVDSRLDAVEADNWVTNARIGDQAVDTAELKDGAVSAAKLAASLDLSGKTVSVAAPSADAHASTKKYVDDAVAPAAWVSYTPTLGSGMGSSFTVSAAAYGRAGKTVIVRLNLVAGATVSGTGLTVTLPVAAKYDNIQISGLLRGTFPAFGSVSTSGGTSTVTLRAVNTASTYGSVVGLSSTIPASWVDGDTISAMFIYEGV